MSLFETIEKDYVQAYKAKDAVRLTVLRLLKTAVKNRLVDLCRPGGTLDDAEMLDLIIKEGKQRQDSIEQYTSAGRQDLADKEAAELAVIQSYLPKPLTEEELTAACKKASIHDFIMSLPKGYDTEVGELGDTLSGGERQRIGLARVFLHDAPFILLDEPTSNLDSLNEAVILQSLAKERGKKTVVLVSHRPSTMRIADQVYSVESGRMS